MSNCLRIGLGISSSDVFWAQVSDAIYRCSEQHPVEVISISRSNFFSALTVDEQNALIEEITAQELDVLIGWSFPESLSYTVLDMGTPIVHLFETVVDHPLCVSPIGLQNIAEQLAHYLAGLLNGKGNVLVIGGLMRDDLPDDGRSRIAGIRNAFREYPELQLYHVPTEWQRNPAEAQLNAGLEALPPPIDAIFGLSDSLALLGRDVVLRTGRASGVTPVVGINGDPLGLAAIIEGRMVATIETSAVSLANQAFEIALKIATGQPYPAHYTFNPRFITADNIAKVASETLVSIASIPNHLVNFERNAQQDYQAYLETSLDISRQIGSVLDYQDLPTELARLIRTNYGYDHAQLFYWSEPEQALILMEGAENIRLHNAGLLGEALDKPIFIPDSQRSIRFAPDPDWPQTRSRVIIPIRQGNKIQGLLDLHAFRVVNCTRQQLMGLQALADQIGVAIRNAQLYTEALEARRAAEKADQLKSRLLANVSHELRHPLHVILGSIERLEISNLFYGESQSIQKHALHLLRLINDLVDLSRAEINELSITPEWVEPVSFLVDVFESMADYADPHIRWQINVPERLPTIYADLDRLRQILMNVLSNAKKFTSEGYIQLGAELAAPHLHIWIEDSGIGIPAQQQQLIFEPFAPVPENNKRKDGVGLGLSIARRLVALHGGLMTVDSYLGKGSTFHIYLPLPNLMNTPLAATSNTQAVLLVVSARPTISPEILTYCQQQGLISYRVANYDDLERALVDGLPRAIAWDADHASETEESVIHRLRTNPQLCTLPFLLYRSPAAPITSMLLKPVKPETLLSIISSLFNAGNSSRTILVVDDDETTLTLYQNLLSENFPEFICRTASNGQEALAISSDHIPYLVILDLMMPECDGFEVIRQLRADRRTQDVPIAVLSGKILSLEDIKRLEPYSKVTFQNKDMLSDAEFISSLQQVLFDRHVFHPQTSAAVKHAVAYIQQHYAESVSRSEIAQAVGVSENYLTHIFHQELGISLWDYLNRYRILQAKELLLYTHDSIAHISTLVGFDDPAYFSRVFRRYVGQSPRVYRSNTPV